MSNTKFTQGPWYVGKEWGHINPKIEILKDISYADGVEPTTYHIGEVGFPTSGPNTVGAIERKANANLIAAATETYHALVRCISELERASSMGINIVPGVIEDACDALRKARGEA